MAKTRSCAVSLVLLSSNPALASLLGAGGADSTAGSSQSAIFTPSVDVTQYVADRTAAVAAKAIKIGRSAINAADFAALGNSWQLMAVHLNDIALDSQLEGVWPSVPVEGPAPEFYDSIFDKATKVVQRHEPTITKEHVVSAVGPLNSIPVTSLQTGVAQMFANGVGNTCSQIAGQFQAMAKAGGFVAHSAFHDRLSTPHLIRVAWCGNTKSEQYKTCAEFYGVLAVMIIAIGLLACGLIPACDAALAAAAAFNVAVGSITSAAALATTLIQIECAGLLA